MELQSLKVRGGYMCVSKQGRIADSEQRQTVISQFYQIDRLVVEGGISVSYAYRRHITGILTSTRASRRATTRRFSDRRSRGKQEKTKLSPPIANYFFSYD
jgi:hypothetical protein